MIDRPGRTKALVGAGMECHVVESAEQTFDVYRPPPPAAAASAAAPPPLYLFLSALLDGPNHELGQAPCTVLS